jgi:putative transposase
LVSDLDALDRYRFCGHSALMGKFRNDWQDTDYVLKRFGKRALPSRKGYREFVLQGIGQGRRIELVGGGQTPGFDKRWLFGYIVVNLHRKVTTW